MYAEVLLGAAAVLVVLTGLRMIKPTLQRRSLAEAFIRVEYERGHGTLGPLVRGISDLGGQLRELSIDDPDKRGDRFRSSEPDEVGLRRVTLRVASRGDRSMRDLADSILSRPEVRSFHFNAESD